ncbi:alanyl-tRNA editing protein [Cytobacillus spongiae]|uniref:alanyl-tRNA editing protein n=1 Tax=Cytobacillus spongiae TaxID=2901381 RepID=UPI003D7B2984
MTFLKHKIYYQNPYQSSFTAKVEKVATDEQNRTYVVLSETAFYPTGGGQPHDIGTLNGVPVIGVEEINGEIRHYPSGSLEDGTTEVQGEIDWVRRFDHMQQHAGQHILTAAFIEVFGMETTSFHLGKETCTIDLDIENLTEAEALAVEEKANAIILENRPIETKWVSMDEAGNYPLRKELAVTGNIRLVIIPDYDYNGCGGTHPRSTGEVSAIKILGWEKQRKKIRVQFICGKRIIKQLHLKQQSLVQLSQSVNAPEEELVHAVSRLLEQNKQKDKTIEALNEQLLQGEAERYLQTNTPIISAAFKNRSIQDLQKLAKQVIEADEERFIFFVSENEDKLQFVGAAGKQMNINLKELAAEILPSINGKGGGSPSLIQGGGSKLITGEELICLAVNKLNGAGTDTP